MAALNFLTKTADELTSIFVKHLLITNRAFNYYVDWSNVDGFEDYLVEIHALDVLIGCKDDNEFKERFESLLKKLPQTILLFPFLFGLAKAERRNLNRGRDRLTIIQDKIDGDDNLTYDFPCDITALTDKQIESYYDFFIRMGLKDLYQHELEKSTLDYIIGVLVGLDSNGRKNRGGKAFELACQPIFEKVVNQHGLMLLTQKQFVCLRDYGFEITDDIANRKADFIVFKPFTNKAINFEVNFYNGTGSKPEEIIDSYINRQNVLNNVGIEFSLVTDGKGCWTSATNQLNKGFRHMKYLQNFYMLKNGMLDEILTDIFN